MKRVMSILTVSLLMAAPAVWAQGSSTQTAQQPQGQTPPQAQPQPAAQDLGKVMREFRGIKLGMKAEEVQKALGKPDRANKKENSAEFNLGDGDLMTIRYNDQGEVNVIQLYFSDNRRAPKFEEVVGGAEIQEKPNGSKFARQVVAGEKFWVTMYQSKSGAVTTVTISHST